MIDDAALAAFRDTHPRPAPAQRPLFRRRAVRVVVQGTDGRLLLLEDSDLLLDPVPHWWIVPGGGVDQGETDEQTAVRELAEEAGLIVTAEDLVGPLAVRQVVHGYSDQVVVQDEVYYLVRVAPFVVDTSGHTPEEQLTLVSHRWWSPAELAAEGPEVWPRELLAIVELADDHPGRCRGGPVDLGRSEESTVPVGRLAP